MTKLTLGVSLPGAINGISTVATLALERLAVHFIQELPDLDWPRPVFPVHHGLNPLRAFHFGTRHFDHLVRVHELDAIILRVLIDDATPPINPNHRDDAVVFIRKRIDFPSKRIQLVLFSHNQQSHHLLVGWGAAVSLLERGSLQSFIELVAVHAIAAGDTGHEGFAIGHGVSPVLIRELIELGTP